MRALRSRALRAALLAFAAIVLPVGITAYRNFTQLAHVWSDQVRLAEVAGSSDPLAIELANGRYRPGDRAADLLERHQPFWVIHDGRYTTFWFGAEPGDTVVAARDGRLVFARPHVRPPAYTFFNAFAPGESNMWTVGYNRTNSDRFFVSVLAGCAAGQQVGRWEPTR